MNWFRADNFFIHIRMQNNKCFWARNITWLRYSYESKSHICFRGAPMPLNWFISTHTHELIHSAYAHNKNSSVWIIIKMSLQDQKAINRTNYWCPNSWWKPKGFCQASGLSPCIVFVFRFTIRRFYCCFSLYLYVLLVRKIFPTVFPLAGGWNENHVQKNRKQKKEDAKHHIK